MTILRDDFNLEVKRTLQNRVGNRCSNPQCRQLTSGPNSEDTKAVQIGVAAHITAAAKNGPRYDPNLTPDQRKNINNGIWLCQNCAKLIDNDQSRYTVEKLKEWKTEAEAKAKELLKGGRSLEDLFDCPFCGKRVRDGFYVCNGCQAEVQYGATDKELRKARNVTAIIDTPLLMILFWLLLEPLDSLEQYTTIGTIMLLFLNIILFRLSLSLTDKKTKKRFEDQITFFRDKYRSTLRNA